MEKLISNVTKDLIQYFDGDVKRINHALKVHSFAKCIGELENISDEMKFILETAAILHDIGIKESERKYNSSAAKYQEIEGPPVAETILLKYNLNKKHLNRILFLIGNHHTHSKIDDVDFQILVEADFLVNIFEDELELEPIVTIRDRFFKTKSGICLINSLYL
jgi:HD superfamily phosphodiesterase